MDDKTKRRELIIFLIASALWLSGIYFILDGFIQVFFDEDVLGLWDVAIGALLLRGCLEIAMSPAPDQ